MRRRLLYKGKPLGPEYLTSDEAVAGDVVFCMSDGETLVIKRDPKTWKSDETPIGVVVIPGAHDVYGTGECGVMSIVAMSCITPDTGDISNAKMYLGPTSLFSELPILDSVPICGSSAAPTKEITSKAATGYIPSTKFSGTESPHDKDAKYYNSNSTYAAVPSPYLTDGSRNPLYFQRTSPADVYNCLADFSGKDNSSIIIEKRGSKNYSSWAPTATTAAHYPAFSCCDMFKTMGTNQRDWYLPAMGELGYVMVRLKEINLAIANITSFYGGSYAVEVPNSTSSDRLWSSSQYKTNGFRVICLDGGNAFYYGNTNSFGVRAFLRLKIEIPDFDKIEIEDTEACDVVFAKSDGSLVIRREESTWKDNEVPIGIVVIPASHGVLKDGTGTVNQCGVMSLVSMSYVNPTEGAPSEIAMYWGYSQLNISNRADELDRYDSVSNGLLDSNKSACDTSGSNKSTKLYNGAYLPRQKAVNTIPMWDSKASTYKAYVPSPYANTNLKSGAYNSFYGTTEFDTTSDFNVLADFKGIVNTKIIIDLSGSNINNSYNTSGVYPAAQTCASYRPFGTKAFKDCEIEELKKGTNFWYLPAAGELGYIIPRLYDINNVLSKLKNTYGGSVPLSTSNSYWSSSESSQTGSCYINTASGYIGSSSKTSPFVVRAFMCLDYSNLISETPKEEETKVTWQTRSGTWNRGISLAAYDEKQFVCVSPGSDGSTVIRCTITNAGGKTATFVYRSDAESTYDYCAVNKLDTACTRSNNAASTSGKQGQDLTYSVTIPDDNAHFVEFCYSKDSSVDTQPDNATVYLKSIE